MLSLKKILKQTVWILFTLGVIILLSSIIFSSNYYSALNQAKLNFDKKELEAAQQLTKSPQQLFQNTLPSKDIIVPDDILLHIYKNDSLIYWNTNKIPISQFAEINFPSEGLIKTRNGWYYTQTKELESYTIASSFLIKNEFAYTNDHLQNNFDPAILKDLKANLVLEESIGFPIYNRNKTYLFSIALQDNQQIPTWQYLLIASLLIALTIQIIWLINYIFIHLPFKYTFIYLFGILAIRSVSLHFNWFGILGESELFKASLYGTSTWFPNLFEYLINIVLLINIVYLMYVKVKQQKNHSPRLIHLLLFTLPYFAWIGTVYLFNGLIENSSIPFNISKLFQLNIYSIIAILSMALVGFTNFIIGKTVAKFNEQLAYGKQISIHLLIGIIFLFIDYLKISQIFIASLFPLLFHLLIYTLEKIDFKQKHLAIGTILLTIYSLTCSVIISEFVSRKDRSERELYASQLTLEKDILAEIEYGKIQNDILNDKLLHRILTTKKTHSVRDFEENMERKHFHSFWERYECAFYLFDYNCNSLLKVSTSLEDVQNNLEDLLTNHGEQSEINESMYFIKDFSGQYSYIIKQLIEDSTAQPAILYVTLKSKKIPEEIGFPRLLLSNKAASIAHLENYSLAKYHNNRLISNYGTFDYPITLSAFNQKIDTSTNNFNFNNYNHIFHFKSKNDVVILSGYNTTWLDDLTSFSYLFSLFGILLLPIYIRYYTLTFSNANLSLATKIQISMIAIVLLALIINGLSSGLFVKEQYSEYSNLSFKEKTHAIEKELENSIARLSNLSIQENGPTLSYQLQYLSKIHNTDINLYDKNGYLISSSRQRIFNAGILSEQMNANALHTLRSKLPQDFIHTEEIGNLAYASSYAPLYNRSGKKLGYVNLQHFGQQEEVEDQLQQFLVSIINIFVLLLVISTVVAIFTANWITHPLQMLQELFASLHLGKNNQRIAYSSTDEIGALVKSYNEKLDELEIAAQQLAASERESAWRDMAKQVAHEIKNPLTPMKLTVQHLQRSFDPTDPNINERIEKVSNSLIEQIDSLTRIANEFSHFAKMPKPSFEQLDINELIRSCVELFTQSTEVEITVRLKAAETINADREQLLRVFNNLLKNAIQAIAVPSLGKIDIYTYQQDEKIIVEVTDNGSGMDKEQQSRIFTPYFTTKSTGTGIGLSMIKQIVENHQGSITFKSQLGVGTTFIIVLPKQTDETTILL